MVGIHRPTGPGLGDDVEQQVALAGTVERVQTLTATSVHAATTTVAAITRTADVVADDCRLVTGTLDALGDALDMFGRGGGLGQDLGGFGMIGLPLMGAVRMVKSVAGQYVKQQTGTSLSTWVDFVGSSSEEFAGYLAQLSRVAEIAARRAAGADARPDRDQLLADLEVLRETQWRTRAWKLILKRVAQLGQVVDAVLKVNLSVEADEPHPDGGSGQGLAGRLQRQLKDVQSRTTERTADLRQWVLQPFADLRDRTRELPAQTERLARQISLLELLLDLEIARIRVLLGDVPAADARMVGLRVAAAVRLPELSEQLAAARRRRSELAGYLSRLEGGLAERQVSGTAHAVLRAEYLAAAERNRDELAGLEAEADGWRRDGGAVVDECAGWADQELEVLAARRIAEQRDPDADRWGLLARERERLREVDAILATL